MKSVVAQLSEAFRKALMDAYGMDIDPLVGPAQNIKFGDYQANFAMGFAKALGEKTGQKQNPRAIAENVKSKLDLGEVASEVSIAGPGFINVRVRPEWLSKQVDAISEDARLGIEPAVNPQRVVIDYSAPNIAKQMHVGHLRSTNIGDALSRAIEFLGHQVIRQNHVGDWGTQFGMLLKYLKESDAGAESHIADLEGFYRAAKKRFDEDPQFADEARKMVVQLQGGDEETVRLWRRIVDESRRCFSAVYARMNVKLRPEDERGESFYNPFLADVVRDLSTKGVAVEDQGAVVVWVEGFEAPLIIRKKDGGYGYGTTDLAALRFRIGELKASRIIYVTDVRQVQHFRQFFDAGRRAGWVGQVELNHVPFGMILGDDGTPFKTRSGDTVKLEELLSEAEDRALSLVNSKLAERSLEMPEEQKRSIARAVGIGAIKYFDLNRDPTGNYVFSWDKMLSLEGNTAPYMQYAYARIRSIFRKAAEQGQRAERGAVQLATCQEFTLAKRLVSFGDVVQQMARELKPLALCNYLYDLATDFSAFYENCPVLKAEGGMRASRLALCELTGRTVALGLDLMGIEHPEQM